MNIPLGTRRPSPVANLVRVACCSKTDGYICICIPLRSEIVGQWSRAEDSTAFFINRRILVFILLRALASFWRMVGMLSL